MIRAFIAVEVSSRIVTEVAAAIVQLRAQIPGVRWVAPDKIHLTLKFLGSIDDSQINRIGGALSARMRLFQPFPISAKGLGVFPGPRRPRVLWVGLSGAQLIPLASGVESALESLSFAPESRPFTPHLTIGRWREKSPAPVFLTTELAPWRAHHFGESIVTSVQLMQSVLRPEGAEYRQLLRVPLGDGPKVMNRSSEGE